MQKELQNRWGFSALTILVIFITTSLTSMSKQLLSHYNFIDGDFSAFPLAVIISFVVLVVIRRKIDFWLLLPVIFFFISCYQSSLYPDQSWDGLAYHQKAAWFLMHGGNLLFDGDAGNFWINLYPKATWYYAGELGILTGNLIYGSSYQLFIGFAVYSYCVYFFNKNGYSSVTAHLFAIFSLITPIYIAQSYSYYVDALMGFLALMMMLSSIEFGNSRRVFDAVVFVLASVIIVNIKFSGFLYVGVCFLILGVRCLPKIKECALVCGLFAVFLIIGVGVLGANPYVKNVVHGKHIFYPLFGEDKKDIITFAQPDSFKNLNRVEKLMISTFSESLNINEASGREPVLKFPGMVTVDELKNLQYEDLRIGGFGPLYSLCLLLALGFVFYKKGIDNNCRWLLGLIILCTVLNPESWWARYAPHLYTLLLLPLMSFRKGEQPGWKGVYIGILVGIIVVNLSLMYKARDDASKAFNDGLEWILQSCQGKSLYLVPFNNFLIEPLAQRGTEKYIIGTESKQDAREFRRKFYYSCE